MMRINFLFNWITFFIMTAIVLVIEYLTKQSVEIAVVSVVIVVLVNFIVSPVLARLMADW